jgi:hypothetical protein
MLTHDKTFYCHIALSVYLWQDQRWYTDAHMLYTRWS